MSFLAGRDYIEIATIIQQFLDGTADRWAWNDFIRKRRFRDPYLNKIRLQCDLIPLRHPSNDLTHYCDEDGLHLLREIVSELKIKAAEIDRRQQP